MREGRQLRWAGHRKDMEGWLSKGVVIDESQLRYAGTDSTALAGIKQTHNIEGHEGKLGTDTTPVQTYSCDDHRANTWHIIREG